MEDLRQACDRCHGKKLRCPKQPASQVCLRCAKANATCVYSPPIRPARGGPGGDRGPAQQLDIAAFDWHSFFDFDPIANGASGSSNGNTQYQNATNVTSQLSKEPKSQDATEMEELTRLLNCLDGLHIGCPAASGQIHASIQRIKSLAETPDAKFDLQMTLELLLQYGQELVQLYPKVLKRANYGAINSAEDDLCTVSDCIHKLRQSLRPREPSTLDSPLLCLLVACHLRLIDIVENVMDHSRVCSHLFSQMPPNTEPNFEIPEIRIGSFVAPKGSAASIVTTMLIELQSSLQLRCREMHSLTTPISEGNSLESRILAMQCESLEQRSTTVIEDMRQLREKLFSSGVIR